MTWRAEWLKRASPEAVEEYRRKNRERVRQWAVANPDKVKARKISPAKAKQREEKRALREQTRLAARLVRAEKHKVYAKSWHQANRQAQNEKRLEHYRENREAHLSRCKEWVKANRERSVAYKAQWNEINKDKLREWAKVRAPVTNAKLRSRRASDADFAIMNRLRCRMRKALLACGAKRTKGVIELIGCSPADFRQHIESQFVDGMTWDNRSQWHLDHRTPCAAFDLTDPAQQIACFHYSNIQPLWGPENCRKGAKIPPEFQPAI